MTAIATAGARLAANLQEITDTAHLQMGEQLDLRLETVDVGATTESADIFVAYPTARGVSAKVRALIEALKSAFGNPPYWER